MKIFLIEDFFLFASGVKLSTTPVLHLELRIIL